MVNRCEYCFTMVMLPSVMFVPTAGTTLWRSGTHLAAAEAKTWDLQRGKRCKKAEFLIPVKTC